MVKPIGWDKVRPYWWCDNPQTRAVQDHLWYYLKIHPQNGIYIKGMENNRPESIEINSLSGVPIININTNMSNLDLLLGTVDAVRTIMDSALLEQHLYVWNREEYFKPQHTFNLQYKWQKTKLTQ